MKDITGSSASFPAQRGFETGDELNETNFDALAQTAADRAAWLKAKVDDMLATGIKKIRVVAGSAPLKALTGMVTGDVAMVSPAAISTMGLYVFRGAPLGFDISRWSYDADDASGHWLRDISPLMTLGGNGGNQPRLDTSAIRAPNSIVGWIDYYESGSPLSLDSNGVWQSSAFISDPFSLEEGDIVDVSAHISVSLNSAVDEFELRLATDDQTAVAAIANTNLVVSPRNVDAKVPVTLRGQFAAQSTNLHTVRVQLLCTAGVPISQTIHAKRSFKGMIVRP